MNEEKVFFFFFLKYLWCYYFKRKFKWFMVGYWRNFWLILNVINDIFIGIKYFLFR